jgi:DNA primase large subunit
MEGKRADYTPYSCSRIITSSQPGAGDHHGCPFRHFSPDNLRHELLMTGIDETDIHDILQLVASGHYQVACTKLFELTQLARARQQGKIPATSTTTVETITHPNHYFEQAFNLVTNGKQNGMDIEQDVNASQSSLSQHATGKRWRGNH